MALTTFSTGNLIDPSPVNTNFLTAYSKATDVYTSTGFDATAATSTANTTRTISGSVIIDYIRIVATLAVGARSGGGAGANGTAVFKIETSTAGAGVWTTQFNRTIAYAAGNLSQNMSNIRTIEFYYAPSAGEKSSGLDIKFTTTCADYASTADTYITNIQTIIYTN